MIGVWVDYSGGRPGGAALRAAGITGVVRYVGIGGQGKRLTHAEYADLVAHGIQVAAVVEATTTDADGGYNAGVLSAGAAQHDLAVETAGLPPIEVVFAANDKPTFDQADVDYVRGFRDVFSGAAVVGPYGFGSYLTACSAAGLAPVAWQAGPAPSRTGTTGVATFWQRQGGAAQPSDGPAAPTTQTINGVVCDLNNQLLPLPGGIDVNLTDPINVTNGTTTLPATTVGAALGRILFELTYPIPSRATVNADPKQVDTMLGRAADADAHGWDAVQLLNQLMSKVDALTTATSTANSTAANLQSELDKVLAAVTTGQQVTLDATQLANLTAQLEAALPSYTVSIAPKA